MDDLLASETLPGEQKALFRRFAALFVALIHHRFHRDLEDLKASFRPFSPDPDTVALRPRSAEELRSLQQQFRGRFEKILNDANYENLSTDELNKALKERSPYGLTFYVDLKDYDELLLSYRGLSVRVEHRRTWKKLYLGMEQTETPIYRRLALLLKLKPQARLVEEFQKDLHLTEKKAVRRARKKRRQDALDIDEDAIYLKLFKDVPRSDIEMLFPTTRVRMDLFDKIKMVITGGGGILFGLFKVIAAFLVTTATLTIGTIGILCGFFGLLGRQVIRVFNLRTKYMAKLARNLYLNSLDNNAGVFTYLIVGAEEEECKEALLACFFLCFESEEAHDRRGLDQRIERHLRERYGVQVDFEIRDALKELRARGLLIEEGGRLSIPPLDECCRRLDREWDNFFQFPP